MSTLLFVLLLSFACFLQGIAGFGFAILATPITFLFLEKQTAVLSIMVVSIVLNLFLFLKIKSRVDYKTVLTIFIASLTGMPIGIYILQQSSVNTLKIFIGVVVLAFTIAKSIKKSDLPKNPLTSIIIGIVSGIMNTSVGMSGPAIVVYLSRKADDVDLIRKNMSTIFLIMPIVSLFFMYQSHILTFDRVSNGLYSAPFVILSGYLGDRFAKKVSRNLFEKLTLAIVVFASIYCIYSGLFS
ncbi:MAG: sulfite exporter TauE/SafE family protein [Patescibacteria group bacterium]